MGMWSRPDINAAHRCKQVYWYRRRNVVLPMPADPELTGANALPARVHSTTCSGMGSKSWDRQYLDDKPDSYYMRLSRSSAAYIKCDSLLDCSVFLAGKRE